MATLIEFLKQRLDEDERWAREASRRHYLPPGVAGVGDPEDYAVHPGGVHWQWECGRNDEVLTVDPMLGEFLECSEGCVSAELRSIERWPLSSARGLPQMPLPGSEEVLPPVAGHIARHDPARVLAEVEAKRQIIAKIEETQRRADANAAIEYFLYDMVEVGQMLALPYADHPDYDQSWKPE